MTRAPRNCRLIRSENGVASETRLVGGVDCRDVRRGRNGQRLLVGGEADALVGPRQ